MTKTAAIKISASGKGWSSMKNEIHEEFVRRGFVPMRRGTYVGRDFTAADCLKLITDVTNIAEGYPDHIHVSELNISCPPYINVVIRVPKKRP